jgi:protocatechuate 3,4-dioxygenase beta subunit
MDGRRRRFLMTFAGLALGGPLGATQLLQPTPRQSAGPFYPPQLPLDDDNDLTRVRGRGAPAMGQSTDLSGRVIDQNGRPLTDARIEIWQCDANGRYRHPRDPGTLEPDLNFQGHGHTLADAGGRYRFRTIRPVPYPGRTPHIHVAVLRDGGPVLVTQLYVEGEPRNGGDFLFNRVPPERRHLVVAEFQPAAGTGAELQARFDIVVADRDGTPAG